MQSARNMGEDLDGGAAGWLVDKHPLLTGVAYETYKSFCDNVKLRPLTRRAFSGLLQELDMYGFVHVRVISRGRYGRTTQITPGLPKDLLDKLKRLVLIEFDL